MRGFGRIVAAFSLVLCTGLLSGVDAADQTSGPVARAVPAQIAFQGLLFDDTQFPAAPVEGTVNLTVRLWDAASGGTAQWGPEAHVSVPVNQGVFQIALGSSIALPISIFDGSPLWLGIEVNAEAELPRTQLLAAPFAMRAQEADHALTADSAIISDDGDWTQSSGDLYFDTGNVGIGTNTPGSLLDVAGQVTTEILEITGGADLAEPFEMSDGTLPVGSVVVIDAANPGQLRLAGRPYDSRVAGVISGAGGVRPGLTLHQEGTLDGGQNVALTGRVYVRATAANGPIQPGDLLTTSGEAGHAMKATDTARTQGALLGKAMSSLESGSGLVLVLVALQ
jgi:hypothetical protein